MVHFKNLTDDEKARIIWYNGTFITSVYSSKTKFNLFSLFNQFIEVKFNLENDDVQGIEVLNSKELDRYLHLVELPQF